MKKNLWTKITALVLSLAVFTLAGCNKEAPVQEPEILETERVEVVYPLKSFYYGESKCVDYVDNWEEAMESLDVKGAEVVYKTTDGKGYVLTQKDLNPDFDLVNVYIAYETEESVYIENVAEGVFLLQECELCEVDGNSETEEIAIHMGYSCSSGACDTQIWNFEYERPNFMFSSMSDFGYTSVLNEGYEIVFDNAFTDYQTRIEYKNNEETLSFFDENGNPKILHGPEIDPTSKTIIEDVDGDGECEIICEQNAWLGYHANAVCSIKTTIDYNTDLMAFVIVDSEVTKCDR
jgi:hypothetical protein